MGKSGCYLYKARAVEDDAVTLRDLNSGFKQMCRLMQKCEKVKVMLAMQIKQMAEFLQFMPAASDEALMCSNCVRFELEEECVLMFLGT